MKKVTGIGGIFFKSKDPKALKQWYADRLGFVIAEHGSVTFNWKKTDAPEKEGTTVWSPFKESTEYFQPSQKDFMFNYIVEDLKSLMEELKKEGVEVAGEMQEFEYGKFAWILDPEGNKIELWEPAGE
jgi:predicted enzyme related to lactoylglutathione lyase